MLMWHGRAISDRPYVLAHYAAALPDHVHGRGQHSSNYQLNLSRFCN